ncbi:MAG: hypothetical protein WBB22_06635 [Anaerolineae bacterium]
MTAAKQARLAQELEHVVNCCNGRVGRRLLELAEQKRELERFVLPTGVELLNAATDVGMAIAATVNCCNGRVGRRPIEELTTMLGGS